MQIMHTHFAIGLKGGALLSNDQEAVLENIFSEALSSLSKDGDSKFEVIRTGTWPPTYKDTETV